jgi:hypothetical protein
MEDGLCCLNTKQRSTIVGLKTETTEKFNWEAKLYASRFSSPSIITISEDQSVKLLVGIFKLKNYWLVFFVIYIS